MTILKENSKQLVEAIKDLYLNGRYEASYAIVQLNKFYANGRITKEDFEEQCEFYKAEKEKQNAVVEETTDEQVEDDNRSVIDETVQDEVIEENKEVESAE